MFKLFKKFKALDWFMIAILVGLVVGQVYFDIELPTYTQKILNQVKAKDGTKAILETGGIMLVFSLASVAIAIVVGYIASHLGSKLAYRLRRDMFKKVNELSLGELNGFSTASLITRSTNDIAQVQMATIMLFRMAISAPIMAVWAILKINATSTELTVATALIIFVMIAALMCLLFLVLPRFKRIQKLTDNLNDVTRENLTGLRVVKAYNADKYQEAKFEKVNKDVLSNNLFVNRAMGAVLPIMLLVLNAVTLVMYWYGAHLINLNKISFPAVMAFMMLAMQIVMAFMMLVMLFVIIPRAAVSARRINEIFAVKPAIQDPIVEKTFTGKGCVEFKNVSFKYPDAESYVLENISFKANSGETVAFIGSTGSGKSTLINLVPRFYDATVGEVLVNGVDVKNLKQETLREVIGYVPQKGVLFSGTVASNISYGEENLTREKMIEAAKVSESAEFVEKMQEQYASPIAQGGKNVSGGQKQRLSIARAVAVNPEIYIFDDSFSALDYKTDKKVRANLKKAVKEATHLIVAQRIGTILDADKIIVLEEGKMVGEGTHKELLKKCPVYKEIALSQLTREELGL